MPKIPDSTQLKRRMPSSIGRFHRTPVDTSGTAEITSILDNMLAKRQAGQLAEADADMQVMLLREGNKHTRTEGFGPDPEEWSEGVVKSMDDIVAKVSDPEARNNLIHKYRPTIYAKKQELQVKRFEDEDEEARVRIKDKLDELNEVIATIPANAAPLTDPETGEQKYEAVEAVRSGLKMIQNGPFTPTQKEEMTDLFRINVAKSRLKVTATEQGPKAALEILNSDFGKNIPASVRAEIKTLYKADLIEDDAVERVRKYLDDGWDQKRINEDSRKLSKEELEATRVEWEKARGLKKREDAEGANEHYKKVVEPIIDGEATVDDIRTNKDDKFPGVWEGMTTEQRIDLRQREAARLAGRVRTHSDYKVRGIMEIMRKNKDWAGMSIYLGQPGVRGLLSQADLDKYQTMAIEAKGEDPIFGPIEMYKKEATARQITNKWEIAAGALEMGRLYNAYKAEHGAEPPPDLVEKWINGIFAKQPIPWGIDKSIISMDQDDIDAAANYYKEADEGAFNTLMKQNPTMLRDTPSQFFQQMDTNLKGKAVGIPWISDAGASTGSVPLPQEELVIPEYQEPEAKAEGMFLDEGQAADVDIAPHPTEKGVIKPVREFWESIGEKDIPPLPEHIKNRKAEPLPESEPQSRVVPEEAKPLLDLIDRTESGGSYDTLLGFSERNQFKGVKASEMTVDAVIAFQRSPEYVRHAKAVARRMGRKDWRRNYGTPVGRYQIVGTTLRNLKKNMGLKGTEKFDQAMQDRMFLELVKGRLKQAGGNVNKAVTELRKEWEGLKHVSSADLREAIRKLT